MIDYKDDTEAYSKVIDIIQELISMYGYDECETENEKKWLDELSLKLAREGI